MTGRRRAARGECRTALLFGGPVDAMVGRDHVLPTASRSIVIAFAVNGKDEAADATCRHPPKTGLASGNSQCNPKAISAPTHPPITQPNSWKFKKWLHDSKTSLFRRPTPPISGTRKRAKPAAAGPLHGFVGPHSRCTHRICSGFRNSAKSGPSTSGE